MKRTWFLLILPFLLLGGVYLGQKTKNPAQACASKVEGALPCYQKVLLPLVAKGDYARAASLCLSVRDPECYWAFGSSVPKRSLCSYLRSEGWGAVYLCYHHRARSEGRSNPPREQ